MSPRSMRLARADLLLGAQQRHAADRAQIQAQRVEVLLDALVELPLLHLPQARPQRLALLQALVSLVEAGERTIAHALAANRRFRPRPCPWLPAEPQPCCSTRTPRIHPAPRRSDPAPTSPERLLRLRAYSRWHLPSALHISRSAAPRPPSRLTRVAHCQCGVIPESSAGDAGSLRRARLGSGAGDTAHPFAVSHAGCRRGCPGALAGRPGGALARRRDGRREGRAHPRRAVLRAPGVLRRSQPRAEGRAHVALRGGDQRGDRRGRALRVAVSRGDARAADRRAGARAPGGACAPR